MAAVAPGQIITFYSYKGGTGRSMALANVGYLLARQMGPDSRGVLMIDWDLEAPGLHRYFQGAFRRTFRASAADRRSFDLHPGLIDFFEAAEALYKRVPAGAQNEESERARVRREAVPQLARHVLPADVPGLFLLKAGRFDDGYPERIRKFGWEQFHGRDRLFFRELRHFLMARYDYVLIDSRTGLTDTSGICVQQMPEKLVLVFVPNFQSIDGVLDVARSAQRFRLRSSDLRPLAIFPLASRIDGGNERLRRTWRRGGTLEDLEIPGYTQVFENLFEEIYELDGCDLATYFEATEVSHDSDYAFGERIAARQGSTTDKYSLGYAYANFTRRLTTLEAPWEALPEDQEVEDAKREVKAATKQAERTALRARWLSIVGVSITVAALAFSLLVWFDSGKDSRVSAVLAAVAVSRDPLERALLLTELEGSKAPPEGAQLARNVATDPIPRRVLAGHEGAVLDVAFSPDGARIATASVDREVRVWMASGALQLRFNAEPGLQEVAFSPDGARLVTSSRGGVQIWSLTSTTALQRASFVSPDPVLAAAFSQDGNKVFVVSRRGLYALDVNSAEPSRRLDFGSIRSATFDADGSHVLISSSDYSALLLPLESDKTWDERRELGLSRVPQEVSASVGLAAFSSDGRYLMTAEESRSSGALRLWGLFSSSTELIFGFQPRGPVQAMAFSPGDDWYATGSPDGTAAVYQAPLGGSLENPAFELKGHADSIEALTFRPDGRRLATASADTTVRIWDIPPRRPDPQSSWQKSLAFLRGETTACLSVQQRMNLLSEPDREARERHAACEQRYLQPQAERKIQPVRDPGR